MGLIIGPEALRLRLGFAFFRVRVGIGTGIGFTSGCGFDGVKVEATAYENAVRACKSLVGLTLTNPKLEY